MLLLDILLLGLYSTLALTLKNRTSLVLVFAFVASLIVGLNSEYMQGWVVHALYICIYSITCLLMVNAAHRIVIFLFVVHQYFMSWDALVNQHETMLFNTYPWVALIFHLLFICMTHKGSQNARGDITGNNRHSNIKPLDAYSCKDKGRQKA